LVVSRDVGGWAGQFGCLLVGRWLAWVCHCCCGCETVKMDLDKGDMRKIVV
jgi:hypothetical protein